MAGEEGNGGEEWEDCVQYGHAWNRRSGYGFGDGLWSVKGYKDLHLQVHITKNVRSATRAVLERHG